MPGDTTIRGIPVAFNCQSSIFPESWQATPISARAESISPKEIDRTQSIIDRALSKYPLSLLQENLAGVYCLGMMQFYDVGYGGTNSENAVYIANAGRFNGYTDQYIEQTFHHEFSSILLRNYPALLDTIAWKKINMNGFDYDDPENGIGAIRDHRSSIVSDTFLCQKGFLTQYAMSSLENDFNTLSQNIFQPVSNFWWIADHYPRIGEKVKLLIGFYRQIDPVFTESYFRRFANNKTRQH